jgi:chitinase
MGTGATLLTWSNNWVYGNNPDGTRTGTTTPM